MKAHPSPRLTQPRRQIHALIGEFRVALIHTVRGRVPEASGESSNALNTRTAAGGCRSTPLTLAERGVENRVGICLI
jgi:hypothetical protein